MSGRITEFYVYPKNPPNDKYHLHSSNYCTDIDDVINRMVDNFVEWDKLWYIERGACGNSIKYWTRRDVEQGDLKSFADDAHINLREICQRWRKEIKASEDKKKVPLFRVLNDATENIHDPKWNTVAELKSTLEQALNLMQECTWTHVAYQPFPDKYPNKVYVTVRAWIEDGSIEYSKPCQQLMKAWQDCRATDTVASDVQYRPSNLFNFLKTGDFGDKVKANVLPSLVLDLMNREEHECWCTLIYSCDSSKDGKAYLTRAWIEDDNMSAKQLNSLPSDVGDVVAELRKRVMSPLVIDLFGGCVQCKQHCTECKCDDGDILDSIFEEYKNNNNINPNTQECNKMGNIAKARENQDRLDTVINEIEGIVHPAGKGKEFTKLEILDGEIILDEGIVYIRANMECERTHNKITSKQNERKDVQLIDIRKLSPEETTELLDTFSIIYKARYNACNKILIDSMVKK